MEIIFASFKMNSHEDIKQQIYEDNLHTINIVKQQCNNLKLTHAFHYKVGS